MKINEIELPTYSEKEETLNSLTHGLSALMFLIFGIKLLNKAYLSSRFDFVCIFIYLTSLIFTLLISSFYHGVRNEKYKKILRVLDHSSIFILISGTYTPYTLIGLKSVSVFSLNEGVFGIIIFSFVWICSIIGIILNYFDLKKFLPISIFLYLLEGWCIIIAFKSILLSIGIIPTILLLSGGISYTVGVIFYNLGKKVKYIHTVFHLFVTLASLLMFISVYMMF